MKRWRQAAVRESASPERLARRLCVGKQRNPPAITPSFRLLTSLTLP
jgi:hypothetical protein